MPAHASKMRLFTNIPLKKGCHGKRFHGIETNGDTIAGSEVLFWISKEIVKGEYYIRICNQKYHFGCQRIALKENNQDGNHDHYPI
jgi:hypothetical protein